jgi:hypothetical protein
VLLHAWMLMALAFCAILASLSLLRGMAGLVAVRTLLGGLEAAALAGGGVAGWIVLILVYHRAA